MSIIELILIALLFVFTIVEVFSRSWVGVTIGVVLIILVLAVFRGLTVGGS